MSKRKDIQKHLQSLDEISNIMSAMKNLAYMETNKISAFLDAQLSMVKHIENIAQDFYSFYSYPPTEHANPAPQVMLLIGSERGFCGDFNHALLRQMTLSSMPEKSAKQYLISVGYKLTQLMQTNNRDIIPVTGASVVEEVDNVLNQLINQLTEIQQQNPTLNLSVIYHTDQNQLLQRQLLPPFKDFAYQETSLPFAAELNLSPQKFMLDLIYHYLFSLLYEILYSSLMAENKQRLAHLEAAVQHLHKRSQKLNKRCRVLRQEEIIEEIEIILLNAPGEY